MKGALLIHAAATLFMTGIILLPWTGLFRVAVIRASTAFLRVPRPPCTTMVSAPTRTAAS